MRIRNKGLKYTLICIGLSLFGGLTMSLTEPDFKLGRNIQILFNMFRELQMFYVDEIDSDEMLKNAAAGMVKNLDPYTELIPESDMANFELQITGKYGGIGSLVRADTSGYVMIAEPYKGFPADKAGLVIGDRIIEVNGKSTKGMDVTKVSEMLKGDPGSAIQIKTLKFLTGEEQTLSLKRERITVSGVAYWGMVTDSVGYILHNDFTEDCSSDIRKAVIELKKEGAKSLIIDLRSNGGGSLQEAVKIVSLFVPKGTEVVAMKGRKKEVDATFVTQTEPLDLNIPIVVLVNSQSASAAEIVAGALQDLDRAALVGTRTYGKGLVQSPRPLGYNAYVKLTTAKYYIPSGRCIQAIDYSHHNEDGSVGSIPDSLIKEYTTVNGRKVYDGGGVMPDVVTKPKYVSRFSMVVYGKGHVEEFANAYFKTHPKAVDVNNFKLTEKDYKDFVAFMADKDVDFQSETSIAIEQLRKKAEKERYLDRIDGELDAMLAKLKSNKESELMEFQEELTDVITNEIILRYHYSQGVTRYNAPRDPNIQEAIKLLSDQERYNTILKSQDTARK